MIFVLIQQLDEKHSYHLDGSKPTIYLLKMKKLFRNHCVSCFKLNFSHCLHLRKVQTKEEKEEEGNQTKRSILKTQKNHQTRVNKCRRIKNFFNSRKSGTWSNFVAVAFMQQQATLVCEFSILQIFSVITAPHNLPTPHISKTYLPIVSLNVRGLEFN